MADPEHKDDHFANLNPEEKKVKEALDRGI